MCSPMPDFGCNTCLDDGCSECVPVPVECPYCGRCGDGFVCWERMLEQLSFTEEEQEEIVRLKSRAIDEAEDWMRENGD